MSQYFKRHGQGFYELDRPRVYRGHTDERGARLVAPDKCIIAFQREGDPEMQNLNPLDVMAVLVDHLGVDGVEDLLDQFAGPPRHIAPLNAAPDMAPVGVTQDIPPPPPVPAAIKRKGGRPRKSLLNA